MAGVQSSDEIKQATRKLLIGAAEAYGLKLIAKADSPFMRILYGALLMKLWNPDFMTKYYTTIGRTIYTPHDPMLFGQGNIHDLATLSHELQHIKDSEEYGRVLFSALYLFPQILSLLAWGAFWWRPSLLFLLCLLPLPAPFRVWSEARAYAVSLSIYAGAGWEIGALQYEGHRSHFMGWAYYRMAWHWAPVRAKLEELTRHLIESSRN